VAELVQGANVVLRDPHRGADLPHVKLGENLGEIGVRDPQPRQQRVKSIPGGKLEILQIVRLSELPVHLDESLCEGLEVHLDAFSHGPV